MRSLVSISLVAVTTVAVGAQGPPARNSHVMATGPEGRVVLLGGGASNAPRLVDTLWSWSGSVWQAVSDDGPRNRNLPAAAWDSRRRVLVVYGGAAGASGTRFGDTWEWNGTRWTELNVRTPGPRDHHAMAYDSARGQVVVYGGLVGTSLVGGTWTWDGRTWRMADSVTGPGPLGHHAMAYDSRRQRVVMYGGLPPEGPRHDGTWEWDGTRWERITTTGGPGPRSHHRMAYDAARGVTVLFGGGDSSATETWTYDGRAWTRHDQAGPQPRWSGAMAWDAVRERVVLFGGGQGRRPFASLGDTWEWDGARWTKVTPAPVLPAPLHGEMLSFDQSRRRLMLAGGSAGPGNWLRGTWEWDDQAWIRTADSAASPPVRSGHAMGYDPANRRTFLFGGMRGPPAHLYCDTWIHDGRRWTAADTAPCITDRVRNASIVYDARARTMLLVDGPAVATDTVRPLRLWHWRASGWVLVDSTGPRRTGFSEVAYDPVRSVLVVPVLYGGPDAGTWEWNGRRWTHNEGAGPSRRQTWAMTWAPHLGRTIVMGGQGSSRGPYLDDAWAWDGSRWEELARSSLSPPPRGGGRLLADSSGGRLLYFGGYNEVPLGNDLWEFTGTWRQLSGAAPVIRVQEPAFVALSVPDLEASIRWYGDLFGLSVQTRFGDGPVRGAILAGSGLTIELIDDERVATRPLAGPQDPQPLGVFKAMLHVDRLDAVLNVLRTRGIQPVGHWPQSQPPNLMIRDPDGNLLQFTEHRP